MTIFISDKVEILVKSGQVLVFNKYHVQVVFCTQIFLLILPNIWMSSIKKTFLNILKLTLFLVKLEMNTIVIVQIVFLQA